MKSAILCLVALVVLSGIAAAIPLTSRAVEDRASSAPSADASVSNPTIPPTSTTPPPATTEETTNAANGTATTGPAGIAILWGNLSDSYTVGMPVVSSFYLQNGVGRPIVGYLVLTLRGVTATSQLVLIAGNSPTLITCDAAGCTYTGTSWPIGVAQIGQCDISIEMKAQISFGWGVRAEWHPA
jgi:hypothetical protein